jgi:hypothetical protein
VDEQHGHAGRLAAFNQRKFDELLVYIAAAERDDPNFSEVKLHKLLAFSDFLAYLYRGTSITGSTYGRATYGPMATKLKQRRRTPVASGDLDVTEEPGPYGRRVTVARREPDLSVFDERELELVNEVIRALRYHQAWQVSELSHDFMAGWQVVAMGRPRVLRRLRTHPDARPVHERRRTTLRILAFGS